MGKKSKGGCLGWIIVLIVAAAVGFGIFVLVKKKQQSSNGGAAPVPGPPGAVTKKYAEALKTAMQFLEVQKCIELLPHFRIPVVFFLFLYGIFLGIAFSFLSCCLFKMPLVQ